MKKKLKVGIIMGSDSDLSVMKASAEILEEFNVPYELLIVSAHRTPDFLHTYAKKAVENGLSVIIAGAGGSAHLPGMIAALTPLPVIGVPIKSSTAEGLDSLFSIVQMPPGIPVATVSINGARNAGILAAQIIAIHDKVIETKIKMFKRKMKLSVLKKTTELKQTGFKAYLKKNRMI